MALRIGTMHALVVALVFDVLNSQLINLQQISDTEAVSAARIYWTLKNNQAPEAVELRKLMPIYLQTVIEKDWKALNWKIELTASIAGTELNETILHLIHSDYRSDGRETLLHIASSIVINFGLPKCAVFVPQSLIFEIYRFCIQIQIMFRFNSLLIS